MVIRIPKAQVRQKKLERKLKRDKIPVYTCDISPVFKTNRLTGETYGFLSGS